MAAFGWVCLLAYQWLSASAALACSRAVEEPFRIDPALAEQSAEGPSRFRELNAFSYRVSDTRCSGNTCSTNNCGDSGLLLVRFEPPEEASEGELGYRAIWIGRPLPPALRQRLDRIMPLDPVSHAVVFELGFDEIVALQGEISLVAVDRAGRESPASEPVPVSFSGCTEYFDQPYCVAGGPMPEADEPRCSVLSGVGQRRSSPLTAALALGLCTLLASRLARGKARRVQGRRPRCR